jgi:hypothetical protein
MSTPMRLPGPFRSAPQRALVAAAVVVLAGVAVVVTLLLVRTPSAAAPPPAPAPVVHPVEQMDDGCSGARPAQPC